MKDDDWRTRIDRALTPLELGYEPGDDTFVIKIALDEVDGLLRQLPEFAAVGDSEHAALLEVIGDDDFDELCAQLGQAFGEADYESDGKADEYAANQIDRLVRRIAAAITEFIKKREQPAARRKRATLRGESGKRLSGRGAEVVKSTISGTENDVATRRRLRGKNPKRSPHAKK